MFSLEANQLEAVGSTAFPTMDAAGNNLTPDYGYMDYEDTQRLIIQELPENSPPGQLPRSVSVHLTGGLCDKVKPGDRVEVTGVYKTIPSQKSEKNGVFETVLLAVGIQEITIDLNKQEMTPEDVKNIRKIAKIEDAFSLLSTGVASSIQGHNLIKKAVLLQLLGGKEKVLQNTTHLRGDINILLVGDPSTAKSQMLRQAMGLTHLAIATTGRGSSGVGLTAAVTIDQDTGERHLDAGAMVLADQGLICIDEFDKMDDRDRVAIHEVMEQ